MLYKKNKKGIEALSIGLAIIGVVVLLVVVYVLGKYYLSVKEKMEIQNCKNSIAAHSMIVSGSRYDIFPDIKCPTRYITVKTSDHTKAKEQIADDMYRCWYEWNEGKGPYFSEEGYFCHICSVYTFKPSGAKINGFIKYLSTEPIPLKYKGSNLNWITYMDYFQGYETPNARKMIDNPPDYVPLSYKDDVIDTTNKYATVFIHVSGKDELQEFMEGKRMGASIAGTAAIALGTMAVGLKASLAVGAVVSALATGTAVNIWNPIGWIGAGVLAVAGAGYLIYSIWNTDEPGWISIITFKPYNAEELKTLGCESTEVIQLSHSTK